jgi:molybdate transport repressor ModE-like protein
MNTFSFRYKIWLETADGGVLGDGKWRLLKTIHETGSLKEAMQRHGLTYRKTWDNLNKIEQMLGFPIISSQRGGKEGGKTTLTEQGKAIVKAFDDFHESYDELITKALQATLENFQKQI